MISCCYTSYEQIKQQTKIMQTLCDHVGDHCTTKMTELQWMTKLLLVKYDFEASWKHFPQLLPTTMSIFLLFLRLRGFIGSRQLAKIAAYLVRIYILPPPTLSAFSIKVLNKKNSSVCHLIKLTQMAILKLIENPADCTDYNTYMYTTLN